MEIEGLPMAEVVAFSEDELDALVFVGRPVLFSIGSAEVLGEFKRADSRLTIELAQIDGGGEGVLVALARLARVFAKRLGAVEIEWIVYAVHCAKPNLKLRRILDARGFEVRRVDSDVEAYYRIDHNSREA